MASADWCWHKASVTSHVAGEICHSAFDLSTGLPPFKPGPGISFFSNASCVTFVTFFILLMVVSWSHHHLGAHHHHYHHPHHHSRSCWQSSIKMPPNYYHRLCIHLSGLLLTFSRSRSFIKWSIIYVSDFILLPAKGRLMICISDDYLNEKYTQLRQHRWAGKFG